MHYKHVLRHVSGNIPEGTLPDDVIEKISYRSAPLNIVLKEVGWESKSINVLQVDAEGYDDQALYSSCLDDIKPNIINFEYNQLTETNRSKLVAYISSLGYNLKADDHMNMVAVHETYSGIIEI